MKEQGIVTSRFHPNIKEYAVIDLCHEKLSSLATPSYHYLRFTEGSHQWSNRLYSSKIDLLEYHRKNQGALDICFMLT